MKWFNSLKELIKDVLEFVRVRKQQRQLYGPIINDLEVINTLANALNDQIKKFASRWNLFPETKGLLEVYKKYVDESQAIYQTTRKDILNSLFAEKNKKLIGETDQLQVHRKENDNLELCMKKFNVLIGMKIPMLAKWLASCEYEIRENSFIIIVDKKRILMVNMLVKNRQIIEDCYQTAFGKSTLVEIVERGE